MDKLNPNLRNFLIGAIGYVAGLLAGILFIFLVSRLGVVRGFYDLIDENQVFLQILAIPVIIGLVLAIGGGLLGGVGGWAVGRAQNLSKKYPLVIGSGLAFAVSTSILIIVFFLLISFMGLYNNLSANRIEQFGLIFGLLGLVFGLVTGLLQAFMTVRLRHTWRVILSATLGFALGGLLLGLVVRILNPTTGFVTHPVLTWLILALALLAPFIFGGGALGFTYGRLVQRADQKGDSPQSIFPSRWQIVVVALIAIVVTGGFLSTFNSIAGFLTINPANLKSQIPPVSEGVHWSQPQTNTIDAEDSLTSSINLASSEAGPSAVVWAAGAGGSSEIYLQEAVIDENGFFFEWTEPVNVSNTPDSASSEPQVASDGLGNHVIVWMEGDAEDGTDIAFSLCAGESCTSPEILSDLTGLDCVSQPVLQHTSPAIASDGAGNLMLAWKAGQAGIVYSLWSASDAAQLTPAGCVAGTSGAENLDLFLTSTGDGAFALAFTSADGGTAGNIVMSQFEEGGWDQLRTVGAGTGPTLAVSQGGDLHIAWCGEDGFVQYMRSGSQIESIPEAGCWGAPALVIDGEDAPHLAWYSQELIDNLGNARQDRVLVDSIRSNNGWSRPAIVAQTGGEVKPSLAGDREGLLYLVWGDTIEDAPKLFTAVREVYECDSANLSAVEKVAYETITGGSFRPDGTQIPFCRNQFERFLYTPNPEELYSAEPKTPNGAFDQVALMADNAKYEVLFATMQWEPNETPPSPGARWAAEVANLYQKVKQDPLAYPRGMTVRILLGNYPVMSNFQWGAQIMDVLTDIRAAGVDKMVDPEIGWRLEVANFPGTYPHSHTKMLVVDGKTVMSAGFNYGYLHLPEGHPSGKGYDMFDMGLQVTGPIAQDGISTFDDLWDGADQIECEDFYPDDGRDWQDTCKEFKAASDHVPEVLRIYLPPEAGSTAFSLYRSQAYKEADEFIAVSLASAEESIDMMQVNFSLEIQCMLNLIFPDLCTIDNALPYMHALLESIENSQTHVRVIMENTNSNGLENRIGGIILMEELERQGLSEYLELRFYNGKIHSKATQIDDKLLIIGSQNMHYSAWGENGLTEHSLATNDPQAIEEFNALFETKWEEAIPFEEAEYGSSP